MVGDCNEWSSPIKPPTYSRPVVTCDMAAHPKTVLGRVHRGLYGDVCTVYVGLVAPEMPVVRHCT